MTPPRNVTEIMHRVAQLPRNRNFVATGLTDIHDPEGYAAVARAYAIGQQEVIRNNTALRGYNTGPRPELLYDFALEAQQTVHLRIKQAILRRSAP